MKFTVTGLIALLLITLAIPTFAQDATPEATAQPDTHLIASADGSLSIKVPADWVLKNDTGSKDGISVKLGTTDAALAKALFNRDDVFMSGEAHIEVEVIALSALVQQLPAGTITIDSTPLQIVEALSAQGMPDTFTFGTPGEFKLNDLPAVRMNLTSPQHGEGQLLLTVYDKKWLVGLLLFAASGESDKWDTIARGILASLTVASAAEATPEPSPTPTVQTYTSVAGKFTIQFPAGWVFDDRSVSSDSTVAGGVLASSYVTQFKQLYADPFDPGDVHIELAVAQLAAFTTLSPLAKATDKTPLADIMQGLIQARVLPELTYGTVTETKLGSDPAVQADVSGAGKGEGRVILARRADGSFLYLVIYTAPGELSAGEQTARTVALSLTQETSEPGALSKTAKTQNGLAAVSYPDNWFSRQYGASTVYIANAEDALGKSFGSALPAGQVNILVSMSTTADYIKQANLPAASDAAPLELLQLTVKAVGAAVEFGKPAPVTVADKPAARVEFQADGYSGIAWIIEYQNGATIAVQMLAAPGEAAHWESTALAIAASAHSLD